MCMRDIELLLYQHKRLTDALGLIIWKCFSFPHMLLVSLHHPTGQEVPTQYCEGVF